MKLPWTDVDHPKPELVADCTIAGGDGDDDDEQQGTGDRRALEILHLVAALGQGLGGDVVAGKAAYTAYHEVE